MEIAKIAAGQVEKYPVGTAEVEAAVIAAQGPGEFYFRLSNGPNVPDLSEFGYTVIEPVDPPETDDGEVAVRDGIEQCEPGKWRMVWTVRECSAGEFDAHERDLHLQIDAEAGAFRARFITDVPGQQQTYAEKETEARAWSADPGGTYPFLAAEAAARSIPVADVAAEIIATADAWRGLGALIEAARIAGKRAVTAARVAGHWGAMDAAAQIDWEALLV